ncbi:hypothetical protein GGF31_005659 [Allomyces arbusculus]|nr:hypothetical protein GGF31_005659 [Allomyces arbusculus]
MTKDEVEDYKLLAKDKNLERRADSVPNNSPLRAKLEGQMFRKQLQKKKQAMGAVVRKREQTEKRERQELARQQRQARQVTQIWTPSPTCTHPSDLTPFSDLVLPMSMQAHLDGSVRLARDGETGRVRYHAQCAGVHTRAQVSPPPKKGQVTLAPLSTAYPLYRSLNKVVRLMYGPREIARQAYTRGSAGTRGGAFDQIRMTIPLMSLRATTITHDHTSEDMCRDDSFLQVKNVQALFFREGPTVRDIPRVNSMGADNAGFSFVSGYDYDADDGESDVFDHGLDFSVDEDADEGDDQ